jgi:hypothetical protein
MRCTAWAAIALPVSFCADARFLRLNSWFGMRWSELASLSSGGITPIGEADPEATICSSSVKKTGVSCATGTGGLGLAFSLAK